jgi:hypothetical protein
VWLVLGAGLFWAKMELDALGKADYVRKAGYVLD